MTNNQNSLDGLQEIIWDIFAKRDFEILELPEYRGSIGKRVLGVFEIDQKYTDLLLAAINKTIMEEVLEMIGNDLDYRGNSPEVMVNQFKAKLRQQLTKKYGRE